MARIFITGSADGLGQLSAKSLTDQGHQVVLHARNTERGDYAKQNVPKAEYVILGDLSNMDETKNVAYNVNEFGPFDAVIHNAGVYQASPREIFMVNTIAPYILTCLIQKPKRLIYSWLAVSNESGAKGSGRYFHHRTERRYNPQAGDVMLQERFLSLCSDITGIPFPQ